MLIDGEWCGDEFTPDALFLKLGSFFLGQVKPGAGDNAGYWVAILNEKQIGAHKDREWAKGCVEQEICNRLYNARHAYRAIKDRAPTSTDLYGCGAWEKYKAARITGFE